MQHRSDDDESTVEALFEQGQVHYRAQEYDRALKPMLAAARQGYAAAQCYVGMMHEYGEGVPQNLAKALEWYSKRD